MKNLSDELELNFASFNTKLKARLSDSFTTLEENDNLYIESYKRISSLESWKAYILESKLSNTALSFFIECQNDVLISHTLAKIGSWRPALQSLRSAIENTLYCLYYKDHPVEYELWEMGKHQLPISDYVNYLSKHPAFVQIDENISGLALLKKEYASLSKAVHSSSIKVRMTQIHQDFPAIMIPELAKLNQWVTREQRVIEIVNFMLITMYHKDLEGAKLRNLRKSTSISIPKAFHERIHSQFGVRLFEYPAQP
jgi:hypothetical protein